MKFGIKSIKSQIRNEVAKRYSLADWYTSRKVAARINYQDADRMIYELILQGKPALVGRLGGTEARFVGETIKIVKLVKIGFPLRLARLLRPRWNRRRKEVSLNAGFFYEEQSEAVQFIDLYKSCLVQTDILGAWGVAFTWPEIIALERSKDVKLISMSFTSPWVTPYRSVDSDGQKCRAWSSALEGKNVLVVAGFAESIANQHRHIDDVFTNVEFPRFDLEVIKAPLTAGLRRDDDQNWFNNLEQMKRKMESINFDVALISAGAYSYPLALHAKKLGKIGIHAGGALQVFFGVMGKRWEDDPRILEHVNSSWVRPSSQEIPNGAKEIENGCYW